MKTLAQPALAAALAVIAGAASPTLARPSVFGGGVIVDRDPQNDVISFNAPFLNTTVSRARAGVCRFNAGDVTDFFAYQLPAMSGVTVMTVPLSSPSGGPCLVPATYLLLENSDGSIQHVSTGAGGTDQFGNVDNSGGSVARVRPAAGGSQRIRIDSLQTGDYGLLVSVYTGTDVDFEEQEPNNGAAFALVLGVSVGGPMIGTGTLTAGDGDMYAVDMKRGQTLAAVTTPVENFPNEFSTPDTVLEVYATNGGTMLCSSDDAGNDQTLDTRGSAVRYRAPADGRYFVRVRGFNSATVGKYALTVGLFAPPAGGECPADQNGDGIVNTNDLTFFLSKFGTACP